MKKLLYSLISSIFLFPVTARAEYDTGVTMFRDIVFGAAVGVGVGALVLVSTQNSNNIAPNLATSTLIGAGAGFVLGIVELSFAHSSGSNYSEDSSGLKIRPIFAFLNTDHRLSSYSQEITTNPFTLIDPKKTAMGINISYAFPE